ncbi:hypothetical protein [Nocardioides sp. 1609]|uniref:hypothetical protein n=1 Tax=Nocardioides sp. 1609 TaxID=2508327 RepID=UPI00106FDF7C|nr:hypothetical protein [Nocardioides sp. 1609]
MSPLVSASARLFERTRAAFAAVGLDVAPDDELHTFTLRAGDDPAVPTVVVVMAGSETVCCYAVWPVLVPEGLRTETSMLVARANATLTTSALELDLDTGGLSARAAVRTDRLDDVAAHLLGVLLEDAVLEANRALAVHRRAVEAVLEGASAAAAIALRLPD